MLRVPALVVAPASGDPGATTAAKAVEPAAPAATVTIDAMVVESVQLGGQDEDWDD